MDIAATLIRKRGMLHAIQTQKPPIKLTAKAQTCTDTFTD